MEKFNFFMANFNLLKVFYKKHKRKNSSRRFTKKVSSLLFFCIRILSSILIMGVSLSQADSFSEIHYCGRLFFKKNFPGPSRSTDAINKTQSQSKGLGKRSGNNFSYLETPFHSKTSEDIIKTFHEKWGGSLESWKKFWTELSRGKSQKEILEIYRVLVEVEKAPWLIRVANTLFFINVLKMFKAIETHHAMEIDLNSFKSWTELSLHERRALLLFNFKKWWWNANSDHVKGLSRWLRPSFIITEILLGHTSRGQLSHRLHELLGSDGNLSFFSNLFSHFASEIQIFKSVKNDPQSRRVLTENLRTRVIRLRRLKNIYKNQLNRFQKYYLEITIHRSEVLIALLEKGSPLTQKEIMDLGVNPKGAYGLRILRILTVTNDFVVQIAVFVALGYLLESFFDERIKNQVITGPFHDFFNEKSKPGQFN